VSEPDLSADALDRTVEQLLTSQTFEADELPDVLEKKGYARDDISAAIVRAQAKIGAAAESPAHVQARALQKQGARLLRFGVLWLVVGLAASLAFGAGLLSYLVVIGVGAALVFAGARSVKRAHVPRRDY
jgi:hypothetical protein